MFWPLAISGVSLAAVCRACPAMIPIPSIPATVTVAAPFCGTVSGLGVVLGPCCLAWAYRVPSAVVHSPPLSRDISVLYGALPTAPGRMRKLFRTASQKAKAVSWSGNGECVVCGDSVCIVMVIFWNRIELAFPSVCQVP